VKIQASLQAVARSLYMLVAKRDGASGLLLQTAALPWRRDAEGQIQVLLVTGRNSGRWIVPKGHVMFGKTLAEAAAIEAFEEAGVEGIIAEQPIGSFEVRKYHPILGSLRFSAVVHPLEATRCLLTWPEQAARKRIWVPAEEAAGLVRSDQLAQLLREFGAANVAPS
jgi:8-oxo-dGTP pyrophosphatase MutT (NUDIX family)